MDNTKKLRTTTWLAERLNLSVTTVEKMRAKTPHKLPPHLHFGTAIRYDENHVEQWINAQVQNHSIKESTHTANTTVIESANADNQVTEVENG